MSNGKRGGARLAKPGSAKPPRGSEKPGSHAAPAEKKRTATSQPHKKRRIALIVVLAVVAVLVILFAIYKSWAKLPDLPDLPSADNPTADPITGEVPSSKPISDAARREGVYTFLVAGRDTGGGGNTDTLMLATYDVPNQKLSVMSIPRDTMVNARHKGSNRKINGVWNLGLYYAEKGSTKKGIDYLKEAVGDLFGFTPDFYVIVNWEAFGRLVDAIGGVDFEVPFHMEYKDPTQDLYIDQAAGYRHLSGDDAMQVVRWRHNNTYSSQYANGDLGRIGTQQALMKAIIKQCLQISNVTKIGEFAEIFTDEVETDLSAGNIVAFAERAIFGGLDMENVTFTTLPVTGVYVKGTSYVQVNPEETLALVNESFNPYEEELTFADMEILQYSSSKGYYLYQSSGSTTASGSTSSQSGTSNNTVVTKATQTPKPTATPEASAAPSATPAASHSAKPAESSEPKHTDEPDNSEEPSEAPSAAPSEENGVDGDTEQEETPPPASSEPSLDGDMLGIALE